MNAKPLPCAVCGSDPILRPLSFGHGFSNFSCPQYSYRETWKGGHPESLARRVREWNERQRSIRNLMREGIPKFDAANAKADPRGWA